MKKQLTTFKSGSLQRSLRATRVAALLPAIALLVSIQSSHAQSLVGTSDTTAAAVSGLNSDLTGLAVGVFGNTQSTDGYGAAGLASATSGPAAGVQGQSQSSSGRGVYGVATATTGMNYGVFGQSQSSSGRGVYGEATATTGMNYGVYGAARSPSFSAGVLGRNVSTTGLALGVQGVSLSPIGAGVFGINSATTGLAWGMLGVSNSADGKGVQGWANSTTGLTTGVYGVSASSTGYGVYGLNTSGGGYGVYGDSTSGYGVYGTASTGVGIQGTCSPTGSNSCFNGVAGLNLTTSGNANGLWGLTMSPQGNAVYLVNSGGGNLIFGTQSNGGSATFYVQGNGGGYFGGAVQINGDLHVGGTLTKGGGSFKIDDPLDPANKYLSHSFVESPDMKNIYDGVTRLDARGEAWVELPDYFEALNRDFRYQLTSVGASQPGLYIGREVKGNRFRIAGGKADAKVSWQVTGIRKDAWANAHRIATEEDKPSEKRGTYLYPELYGASADKNEDAIVKH
jgi:hypothetical protein